MKPLSLPNWATDTNYPAGAEPEAATATKVAPTSGQATIGWRPNAIPTAQEQNYWMNVVHQWCAWVDAGILEAVSLTLSGALTVGGTSTLTGAVTAAAGVVAGVNQHFVVSGTGKFKHGPRSKGFGIDNVDTLELTGTVGRTAGSGGVVLSSGAAFFFKLPPVGNEERITSVVVNTVAGAGTHTFSLWTYDSFDATYVAVTGASGVASGGVASMTPTTPVTADGRVYVLKVVTSGGGCTIIQGTLNYDVP